MRQRQHGMIAPLFVMIAQQRETSAWEGWTWRPQPTVLARSVIDGEQLVIASMLPTTGRRRSSTGSCLRRLSDH